MLPKWQPESEHFVASLMFDLDMFPMSLSFSWQNDQFIQSFFLHGVQQLWQCHWLMQHLSGNLLVGAPLSDHGEAKLRVLLIKKRVWPCLLPSEFSLWSLIKRPDWTDKWSPIIFLCSSLPRLHFLWLGRMVLCDDCLPVAASSRHATFQRNSWCTQNQTTES